MLDSESALSRKYGALPLSPVGQNLGQMPMTVVVFLFADTDSSKILRTLNSLNTQSMHPLKLLLVQPPRPAQGYHPTHAKQDLPLADRSQYVAYEDLANKLLQEHDGGISFLHAGSAILPHRLEHDELILRSQRADGVLTIPIIESGKGIYQYVPDEASFRVFALRNSSFIHGRLICDHMLEGGKGEWILDCLTLRMQKLALRLQSFELSIVPALYRCLIAVNHLWFAERCLTLYPAVNSSPN
jgi:hypothetical protein